MTNSATKSAIITGASGGIGGSVAKRLAKDGFSVVVNYAGKPAPAQAVVADLKAPGGQGIAVQADVTNAEDVERDIERGARFALRIQAGMTHVNDATFADSLTGPFGGEKNSGLGRFGGEWIISEFTRDHWVTVRHEKGPYLF